MDDWSLERFEKTVRASEVPKAEELIDLAKTIATRRRLDWKNIEELRAALSEAIEADDQARLEERVVFRVAVRDAYGEMTDAAMYLGV